MKRRNWSLVTCAKESGGTISRSKLRSLVSAAELDDQLAAFSRRGYHFTRTAGGGLEITGWPRRLFAEEIAADLGTETVGRRVEVHWLVPSTNDLARAEAKRGREGAAIFTEEQTVGRGRFGRVWRAAKYSSLLFSVPLHSARGSVAAEGLMLAGAVAVAEAISETLALPARIRWPNDVLVEGKKVSGVLVESLPGESSDRWFVLGAGVNANLEGEFPEGIREIAGSLSQFVRGRVDRALLARSILRRLDFWWELLKAGETARLSARWRSLSAILGRFVTVQSKGKRHKGRVVDLDTHFGLVLQISGGPTRVFAPGEATLVSGEAPSS